MKTYTEFLNEAQHFLRSVGKNDDVTINIVGEIEEKLDGVKYVIAKLDDEYYNITFVDEELQISDYEKFQSVRSVLDDEYSPYTLQRFKNEYKEQPCVLVTLDDDYNVTSNKPLKTIEVTKEDDAAVVNLKLK